MVADSVGMGIRPEIRISGSRNQLKMGCLMQVEQGFFSYFCQIFASFDDFSKLHSYFCVLHFEKASNMTKNWQQNEEKPSSTCLLKHISQWFGFGYFRH